jgi:hypothetical protein
MRRAKVFGTLVAAVISILYFSTFAAAASCEDLENLPLPG